MEVWKRLGFGKTPTWSGGVGVLTGLFLLVVAILSLVIMVAALVQALFVVFDAELDSADLRNLTFFIAALVGAPFVIWRAIVAQKQADTAEQVLITERFTKAVEQLGAEKVVKQADGTETTEPNLEVRLGGIYALEHMARDHLHYHVTIMRVLCAYIRENAPLPEHLAEQTEDPAKAPYFEDWSGCVERPGEWQQGATEEQLAERKAQWQRHWSALSEWIRAQRGPRVDIQAALTVVGTRSAEQIKKEWGGRSQDDPRGPQYRLDLSKALLRKAETRELNFDFSYMPGASLIGAQSQQASFNYALLVGSDFTKALLQGSDFKGAELAFANLAFAELSGSTVARGQLGAASLFRSNVISTDISNAAILNQGQVNELRGNSETILPSHLSRPDHWPPAS